MAQGKLAMPASMLGFYFDVPQPSPPYREEAGVAIVSVCGPLAHHEEWWWDSYEAISKRLEAAFRSEAKAVVLEIDSPGGELAGCFETVREIRETADKAGKPLIAYVNGMAMSGGYALACAADQIFVPETGRVGSIGVIDALVDVVGMDQQAGINWQVIASGARKTDGHPHVAISDESKAAVQDEVNGLAELFFALVADRRKVSVDQIRGMQAGVTHGKDAVAAKLADGVARFSEVLARISSVATAKPSKAKAKGRVMEIASYDDIMGQLKQLADEDSDEGKKAKDHLEKMKTADEGEGTGSTGSTGSKGDDKKEASAMRTAILRETGAASPNLALMVIASWKDSHEALAVERKKVADERATMEATERKQLVVEMVKIGAETPATAWASDKDGVPDGKTPAAPWDTMPIAAMRKRVEAQRVARGVKPSTTSVAKSAVTPTGAGQSVDLGGAVVDLTEEEVTACRAAAKKNGGDADETIQKFAEIKFRQTQDAE